MIWVVIILVIFIFQIATILIGEFRHPSRAVAWLLVLFVFPLIGFVMYYFMAKRFQRRRTLRKRGTPGDEALRLALRRCKLVQRPDDLGNGDFFHQERLYHMLQSYPLSPITACNKTDILNNGERTFEAILSAMKQAKHHIHLDYYTIRDDEIGRRFKEVLIQKARTGVEVRLIYDGAGSYELLLKGAFLRELEDAGVKTSCFLPPQIAFFEKRMNYRNHRKTVVIDGITGFLGGINIGDEYLGKDKKYGFWRDTHLQLTGDSVYSLQDVFMRDWWFAARERLSDPVYFPAHDCMSNEQVQIVSSGPDNEKDAILESVFSAIAVAKSNIYIGTPYFIPDGSILRALRAAALSGVDVRLIIPQVADSRLVMLASLSYVEDLLAAGVRVYRYQKGFFHAKIATVDRLLATVGSMNMDMRSFFDNFELNAILYDAGAIEQLEQQFHEDLRDSKELHLSEFKRRPRRQKAKEAIARLLAPLL